MPDEDVEEVVRNEVLDIANDIDKEVMDLSSDIDDELNSLEKAGMKRRKRGMQDALRYLYDRANELREKNKTKCCGEEITQNGCFGPAICPKCETENPETYKERDGKVELDVKGE